MAGPIYAAVNLLDTAAAIIVDHEDADFPASNLNNKRMSKTYKSDTDFDTDSVQAIIVDAGVGNTIEPTMLALLNHNIPGDASHVIKVYHKATLPTEAVPGTFVAQIADTDIRALDTYFTWSSVGADRYWLIQFSGVGTTPMKIGELVLAVSVQLSRSFIWSPVEGRDYNNITHETQFGNVWSYEGSDQGTWALSWRGLDLVAVNEVGAMIAAGKGGHLPIVVVPFTSTTAVDDRTKEVYFVRTGSRFEFINEHTKAKSTSMILTEEVREFVTV